MHYRKLAEVKNDEYRDKKADVIFLPTFTVVPRDLKRITNTFHEFIQHFDGWKNLTLNEIEEAALREEAPEIPIGNRMRAIEVTYQCATGFEYYNIPHRIAIIVITDDTMAAYSDMGTVQGAERIKKILRDFAVGVAKDPQLPRLSDIERQLIKV